MHSATPFASQDRPRPYLSGQPLDLDGAFASLIRRACAIEQPLRFGIKVAQPIGLQPIGQNAEEEVPGKVRGR